MTENSGVGMLYPGLFDIQLIIFSENRGTSFNWSPPVINVIPIDEKAVPLACFDLKAISQMPDYKRQPIVDSLRVLNEKDSRRGYKWAAAGLEYCDERAVCLVAKLVPNI